MALALEGFFNVDLRSGGGLWEAPPRTLGQLLVELLQLLNQRLVVVLELAADLLRSEVGLGCRSVGLCLGQHRDVQRLGLLFGLHNSRVVPLVRDVFC